MPREKWKKVVKSWLPLAFVIVAMAGLVYLAVQQDLRQGANDPQIQMAEDAATAVKGGALPSSLVGPYGKAPVDIGQSLAPYIVFYDDAGAPVAGTGMLHGTLPHLPQGVFDATRLLGENRITWQPEPGVRSAIILVRAEGAHPGFVMAGRSLRETELREDQLSFEVGMALIVTLVGSLAIAIFLEVL